MSEVPEEGIESPGAGVKNGCEPPSVGTGQTHELVNVTHFQRQY